MLTLDNTTANSTTLRFTNDAPHAGRRIYGPQASSRRHGPQAGLRRYGPHAALRSHS
jgi:hypothetical protein